MTMFRIRISFPFNTVVLKSKTVSLDSTLWGRWWCYRASPGSPSTCDLQLEILAHIHFLVQADASFFSSSKSTPSTRKLALSMLEICFTFALLPFIFRPVSFLTSCFATYCSFNEHYLRWKLYYFFGDEIFVLHLQKDVHEQYWKGAFTLIISSNYSLSCPAIIQWIKGWVFDRVVGNKKLLDL